MFFKRRFTVMVVPDAHARMRRFHVRGRQLLLGGVLALAVVIAALAAPVLGLLNASLSSRLDHAVKERARLEARSETVEATLASLRAQISKFEQQTQKLATIAGLDLPPLDAGGQGRGASAIGEVDPGDLQEGEVRELADRAALLSRRLDTVGEAIDAQSDRLARVPSVLPVRGLMGAGFAWRRDPFTGRRQFHRGLDISAPQGTPVRAPADGIVVKSERSQGYGNVLYLSHGDGIVTRFGHLFKFKVRAGARVRRGDVIGLVGSTGRSTAPHLHYEVLVRGAQVNPMQYVMDDGLFY